MMSENESNGCKGKGKKMAKYTLTSYEPVEVTLPKPQVPDSLVDAQIQKLLEPFSEFHEVAEDRGVLPGDHIVVTTRDAAIDGNPAKNFIMEHSIYHVGAGEMPKTFDDELIGMKPGQTKAVTAKIKLPLAQEGDASALTMEVDVERILSSISPELDDAFITENFAPATNLEEFRQGVAAQFGLPDMAKDDPHFPDIVLDEIAKRLVEDPDPADRMEGMPDDALRIMCAIDALADHLELELEAAQIIAQMPGEDAAQREQIYQQLVEQGKADEAKVFAQREAALSWLVNHSTVRYA